MAHPVLRVLSAFAEFIGRFFPISKDESTVLEELGRLHRSDSHAESTDGTTRG